MFDLYREQILERSQHPHFGGVLKTRTHWAEGENRSCGDEILIELRVEQGVLQEIRHTTRACAICTASADLMAEALTNTSVTDLDKWNSEKSTELLGIPLSPIRLKCALLPFETLKQALKEA